MDVERGRGERGDLVLEWLGIIAVVLVILAVVIGAARNSWAPRIVKAVDSAIDSVLEPE